MLDVCSEGLLKGANLCAFYRIELPSPPLPLGFVNLGEKSHPEIVIPRRLKRKRSKNGVEATLPKLSI